MKNVKQVKQPTLSAARLDEMIARAVAQPQVQRSAEVIDLHGVRGVVWGGGLAALAATVVLGVALIPMGTSGAAVASLSPAMQADVGVILDGVVYGTL